MERIAPIGFKADEGIKMILYGRSATGKTTLWSTFPGPILALICSGSSRPGELRSIDTPECRAKIRQVVLERSDEMQEIVDYLNGLSFGGDTVYQTVVLDHATGFQDRVLSEILGRPVPQQKTWGLATQQQWGQVGFKFKELMFGLLSLKCNVVVVAHEKVFKAQGGEEGELNDVMSPFVAGALIPSIVGWLNGTVEYIAQTFIRQRTKIVEAKVGIGKNAQVRQKVVRDKGVEYCLRTGPDPVYATKFRVPRGTPLPDVIVDPHYDKIAALIAGAEPLILGDEAQRNEE